MGGVGDGKVMGGIGGKSRGGAVFFACAALWWFACGFGLFLIFYRSISFAPHRGEPDRPKAKQGEANAVGEQPRGSIEQTNKKSRKGQRHKQATNAVGKKNPLTPY